MLLQALFTKNMDTSRVLVWGEFSESTVLISFYRKLGFFPTIPSNYPLGFLLSSETIHGIRSVGERKNFLLEVLELISRKYDQERVTTILGPKDFGNKKKIKPSELHEKLKFPKKISNAASVRLTLIKTTNLYSVFIDSLQIKVSNIATW